MKPSRLAALMLMALAAAPAQPAEADVVADTSRIVAIGGSLTEIVFALGEQEHLIARDSTSVYPPEAFDLPDVGYIRALSPEGVLSINPSAILMLEGGGPPEAVDVLKKASVPIVIIPDGFDGPGILSKITMVGHAIGEDGKAAALAQKVEHDLAAAQALTASVTERRKVLFVLSNQGGKLMASGTDTAADGIIRMAGAINAMTGFAGYKQLADEAVIEAQPDMILMMNTRSGTHEEADEELLAHPAIAATPAGRNRAILRMDGAYLLGFGPRTAAAISDLATSLYGEAVGN